MEPLLSYAMSYCPSSDEIFGLSADVWSAVAAIASSLLAVIALFFTWWQLHQNHIHNKLMSTPHIDDSLDSTENMFRYDFSNDGIGPAIITSIEYYYDGKLLSPEQGMIEITTALTASKKIKTCWQLSISQGTYIPVNTSIQLIKIDCHDSSTAQAIAKDFEEKVDISVKYRSIYKTEHSYSSARQERFVR